MESRIQIGLDPPVQILRPEFARCAPACRASRPPVRRRYLVTDIVADHRALLRLDADDRARPRWKKSASGLAQDKRLLTGGERQRRSDRTYVEARAVVGVPVAAHAERDQLRAVEQESQRLVEPRESPPIAQIAKHHIVGVAASFAHALELEPGVICDEQDGACIMRAQED